jgi:hypothetical protein
MAGRIQTDPNLKHRDTPGPGNYELTSIQIANMGHYALSTLKYRL